jgi:hypothetical protein
MERSLIEDWQDSLDRQGPFVSLETLRESLRAAPVGAERSVEYAYLEGLIAGRAIFEELGGVAG